MTDYVGKHPSRRWVESENVIRSVGSDSLQPYGDHQAPLSMGISRQEYWSG